MSELSPLELAELAYELCPMLNHEFLIVGRSAYGEAVIEIVPGAFAGNPMEEFSLAFYNKRSWQTAYRMMRVAVSHGFEALPGEAVA